MLTIIEEQYALIDKSTWPKGEWMKEPDLVRLIDNKGYPYLIRRGPASLGHLCGYAGVFETSPLWEKKYDDIQSFDIELTFAGKYYDMPECIWWFGWDHAHAGDLVPGMMRMRYGGFSLEGFEIYKNVSYVIKELEQICKQLKPFRK